MVRPYRRRRPTNNAGRPYRDPVEDKAAEQIRCRRSKQQQPGRTSWYGSKCVQDPSFPSRRRTSLTEGERGKIRATHHVQEWNSSECPSGPSSATQLVDQQRWEMGTCRLTARARPRGSERRATGGRPAQLHRLLLPSVKTEPEPPPAVSATAAELGWVARAPWPDDGRRGVRRDDEVEDLPTGPMVGTISGLEAGKLDQFQCSRRQQKARSAQPS